MSHEKVFQCGIATNQNAPSPITVLPPEILVRVFLLTVESRSCPLRGNNDGKIIPAIPKHPDSLLLVCSRWRDIAVSSRSLWSHIDIVLSCPQSKAFLARAKAYICRTGHMPLDIHIVDPGTHRRYQSNRIFGQSQDGDSSQSEDEGDDNGEGGDGDDSTLYLVSSEDEISLDNFGLEIEDFDGLGPASQPIPIRSLELAAYCEYHMSQLITLEYYLSRCAPGTLTRLFVQTETPEDEPLGHFIEYGYVGGALDVSREDLERPLGLVTTLHLNGLYPYWTNQAYHGLVDLSLGGKVQVPESQLVEILRHSPELQALCLDCIITDPTDPTARENELGEFDGEPPFDVHLKDLEMLDIHSLNYESAATLLRRLSYSTKPLCLCLSSVNRDNNISHFLGLSENLNVTELRVTWGTLGDLYDYVERYPNLHTLVMGEWDLEPSNWTTVAFPPRSDLYWYRRGYKSNELCLDTVYIIRIVIPYNELQAMVDYYSVRKLVLWNSSVTRLPADAEITVLCPVVERLQGGPNPLKQ